MRTKRGREQTKLIPQHLCGTSHREALTRGGPIVRNAQRLPITQKSQEGAQHQAFLLLRTPYLAGSRVRGWGHRPGACFPGRHAQRPPETRSASPRGQGLAGRAAQGLTRSGGHCLQSHVHQKRQSQACAHYGTHQSLPNVTHTTSLYTEDLQSPCTSKPM